jgi:N-acetylglucosaminyldiphosphoundecaprenol N-acetyl-beta-D-mannosaminyltransferase
MLDGVGIDPVTEVDVVAAVAAALERGEGGRIITPNVDILRLSRADPAVRAHLDDASFVVADGMPLVWASRLAGTPLPERVPGSSLIWALSYHLGRAGRSVYLLGGAPPVGGSGAESGAESGARRAAAVLAAACPGLRIAGSASPPYGFEAEPEWYASICADVVEAKPDLVFVGLGFPKQERLIDALRPELPFTWFLGCGAAIGFVAGDAARAPSWMQRTGLEWAWRLAGDPRRLAGRYLRRDTPYALRLLASASASRASRRRNRRRPAA